MSAFAGSVGEFCTFQSTLVIICFPMGRNLGISKRTPEILWSLGASPFGGGYADSTTPTLFSSLPMPFR